MSYKIVNINFGGIWTSDCAYVGGRDIDIPLATDRIDLPNLRYEIARICNFSGNVSDIHYLKRTRSGCVVSQLQTDQEFVRLFSSESYLKLYVGSNNTASSSYFPSDGAGTSSSYVPTFEQPHQYGQFEQPHQYGQFEQPYQYGGSFDFGYQGSDWHTNLDQIATGAPFSTARGNFIPDLNFAPENEDEDVRTEHNVRTEHTHTEHNVRTEPRDARDTFEVEDDDADRDFDVDADSGSTDSDRPGDNETRRLNRSLFAEYTAWILEEGGMEKLLRLMHPGPHDDEAEEDIDTPAMRNWIVPMVPVQPEDSAVYRGDVNLVVEGLAEDAFYSSKEELTIAVGLWNMERNAEAKVLRSDSTRLYLVCKASSNCPFLVRAKASGVGHYLVNKFCGEHTCHRDISGLRRRTVRSTVIGAYFAKRILRDQEIVRPKVIMNELRELYGCNIRYDVGLRGRNRAIQMIYGEYEDSFKMLPGYLEMLKRRNPGTITEIDIGPDGRFRQVFVAIGAARVTYPATMRPVIIVDGTHLKGKNNGTLFVAVAKDANDHLYPLAYGIGPIENHVCWTFFMRGLKRAYGSLAETVIVSDQHVSIIHAVSVVFPDAYHGLCYYHMGKNLSIYGKHVVALFQRAALTYDPTEWNDRMNEIREENPNAHEKLMEIGPVKWARSMCPAPRFTNMTSNAAESFNSTLLWARRLPICACLDAVRLVMEQWFDKHRLESQQDTHPIARKVREELADQIEHSRRYRVTQASRTQFNVHTSRKTLTVNLRERECECLRWQKDGLPCTHAIAAIMLQGEEVSRYVASYYHNATYAKSYELPILRVPHKSEWPKELQSSPLLPSVRVRMPGRPRERRRRGRGEARQRARRGPRRCKYCDMTTHVDTMCHRWMEDFI